MNRYRGLCLLSGSLLFGPMACQTPLDKKQAELIQTWATTNQVFAKTVGAYHSAMSSALSNHYRGVRDAENAKFRKWIESQVHEGLLVRTDDNDIPILDAGKYQPMVYTELKKAYDTHEETLVQISQDEERFLKIDAQLAVAIEQFQRLSEMNLKQSESIAEAKASAQQLLESSLGVIAGLAAAAAAGG